MQPIENRITNKLTRGVPGNRGVLSFFPKGALTHHLVVAKSAQLRFRPTAKTAFAPLLLLSPQSLRLCGGPYRRWYPSRWSGRALSEGELRFLRKAPDNAAMPVDAGRHCLRGTEIRCTSLCRHGKPATGSFSERWVSPLAIPFLFPKKKQKQGTRGR